MKIKINNKTYEASPEDTILSVCKKNGIRIPALCAHPDLLPSEGVCRMCLVETSQSKNLVPSCVQQACEGLEVFTETEKVNKARKINLELLWVDHAGKCAFCKKNGRCDLQNLAHEYDIDDFRFVPRRGKIESRDEADLLKDNWSHVAVDAGNSSIARDSEYCIECRRCINICRDMQTIEAYGMNYRSSKTNVGTPCEMPLDCIFCGQCSVVCPTAAITEKDDTDKFEKALKDKNKMVIVQTAPSVRLTFSEEFGNPPGTFWEQKLIASLKEIGCDKVFDTVLGADLTIIEEANELINRIKKGSPRSGLPRLGKAGGAGGPFPMFTSCCPSWVLYVEKYYPEFIPNLSNCKSPQQMFSPLVKTYFAQREKINPGNIVNVAIMPCTSKKYEADREEMGRDGYQDTDIVLTIRELARLLRKKKIDPAKLKDKKYDAALGISTGAGMLFAASGGVMEAALRTAVEKITGAELAKVDFEMVRGMEGVRCAEIEIGNLKLKVAVVHEIRNAKKFLESIKKGESEYHFVEVMACPNGCIGGGGQPQPTSPKIRQARIKGVLDRDRGMPIRKSHENPVLKKVYQEFLGKPGSEKAEELLHTKYTDRKENAKKKN